MVQRSPQRPISPHVPDGAGARRRAPRLAGHYTRRPRLSARSRDIPEQVTDAVFTLDRNWCFTYLNAEVERYLGRKAASLIGRNFWDANPQYIDDDLGRAYRRAMAEGVAITSEDFVPSLGSWFNIRLSPGPNGLSVYFRDVTAQRDAETRLALSEARYRNLVEQIPAVVYTETLDDTGIDYVSPFVEELLGDPPSAFVADRSLWRQRTHPDDRMRIRHLFGQADASGGRYSAEYRMVARGGHVVWVHDMASPVLDGDGTLSSWQGVVGDITPCKAVEDELRRLAHRDPLTGLSNRAFLSERLAEVLANGSPGTAAVLFIDLDRFKLVDDAYGHSAGDMLLTTVAQSLSAELGDAGTISRFGGDGFVAILPGTTAAAAAATAVAERLIMALRRPVVIAGRDVQIGGSIGIALKMPHHSSSDVSRLSLDDFGAGTSSLALLRVLQAADLKLDYRFIQCLPEGGTDRTIVTGIATMAHALGMVVTAEGVETAEQAAAARAAGCDRIQGHLVAAAMPPDELAGWLIAMARLPPEMTIEPPFVPLPTLMSRLARLPASPAPGRFRSEAIHRPVLGSPRYSLGGGLALPAAAAAGSHQRSESGLPYESTPPTCNTASSTSCLPDRPPFPLK